MLSADTANCKLTLYHLDTRISKEIPSDICELALSKQAVKKVSDLVATYFSIDQEWDKKLFVSIFFSDPELRWLEFNRTIAPDINLGIKIKTEKELIANEIPKEVYIPIEKTDKLSVNVRGPFVGKADYQIDYEEIRTKRAEDHTIVSLFNCNSFNRVIETSTSLGYQRTLKKTQ